MEKFKTITTIKTINKTTGEETETTTETNYTEKRWDELTTEEKEKEIQNNLEPLHEIYQDDLYDAFQADLEYIRETIPEINFENVYIDSNSQGGWISNIKSFEYNDEGITVYSEPVEVYDIDLHFRKYIDHITEDDITLSNWYNTPIDLYNRIITTRKYKTYINNIIKTVNNWIDQINKECKILIDEEYNTPTNLNDPDEADYLDNYFCDDVFTYYDSKEDQR